MTNTFDNVYIQKDICKKTMSNFGKVVHEKPDLRLLKRKGLTAVDMHFHSKYSDGVNSVSFILKKAKKKGVGVCITDHNEIRGSIIACRQKEVLTIPGIETTTREGAHMLYYFYSPAELEKFYTNEIKQKIKKMSPFLRVGAEDLLDRSKKYNCVSVIAHPYAVAWTGIMNCIRHRTASRGILQKIDGIEVICGANQRLANKKAIELALKMKDKAITGGTDGHIFYELGHTLTITNSNVIDREDFLEQVIKRNCFVVGMETKFIRKYLSHSTKTKDRYKYAFNYLGKYLKYGKESIQIRLPRKGF